MSKPVITDSDGKIKFEGIHDSEILALSLGKDQGGQTLTLTMRTEANKDFKLILKGVRRLVCDDFTSQNVVFDIFVFIKQNLQEALQPLMKRFGFNDKELKEEVEMIEAGNYCFFQVDASVGCEISCICKSVEIEVG